MKTYHIPHTSRITWQVDLENISDPFALFGKSTSKKIRSGLKKLESLGYTFEILSISEELIDEFVPLYEENIRSKENGKIYPIKERVITDPIHNFPYFILALKDIQNKFLGGTIFSNRRNYISTAYKVYSSAERVINGLSIGVSYISEYILYEYAISENKNFIRRGADRNPYGKNSSIGLAAYKMQIGNLPYTLPEKNYYKKTKEAGIDPVSQKFEWDKKTDVLLFEFNGYEERIKNAHLFSQSSDILLNKYSGNFKNLEIIIHK